MKRIVLFIIVVFSVFCFPNCVFADSAHSTVIMDVNSGRILYSKDMNNERLIASTTKIMTCIIVLENSELNKQIEVGNEILEMYGTNIYLEVGEKIKVKDLLYGLMLRSGNDAAEVLANNVFGNKDIFIMKMNEKAKELGMNSTSFYNSHGLDDNTKNYSTAYDMALLGKYAYNNKMFRKIVRTKKYTANSDKKAYTWYNRMALLNDYKYCIGGKNGYTPKAGKSLVSYAKKDDLVLTIVTLDDDDIYNNHKYLYKKYFDSYKLYNVVDKDNFNIDSYFLKDKVFLKKSFYYPLRRDELDDVSTLIKISNETYEDIVGEVDIKLKDEEIGKVNIYKRKEKKEDTNIFNKIINLFRR